MQKPEIVALWSMIEPLIDRALQYNPRFTAQDIKAKLLTGVCQLWESGDFQSVLITEIHLYPKAKVMNLFLNSGKLDLDSLKYIEQWAKTIGCTEIEETGRRGWVRKLKELGYQEVSTTMRKEI